MVNEQKETLKENELNKNEQVFFLLTNKKSLKKVFLAQSLTVLSSSMYSMTIAWITYLYTRSIFWSLIAFTAIYVPKIFIHPFVSFPQDKLNKKMIVLISTFLKVFLIILEIIFIYIDIINQVWIIIICILSSIIEAIETSCISEIVIDALEEEDIKSGCGLLGSLSNICSIIGFSFGGFIISIINFKASLILAVLILMVSGIIYTTVKIGNNNSPLNNQKFVNNFKKGFISLKDQRFICILILIIFIFNSLIVPFNALASAYTISVLRVNASFISFVSLAIALGNVIGTVFYYKIIKKYKMAVIGSVSFFTLSLYYLIFFLFSNISIAPYLYYLIFIIFSISVGFVISILTYIPSEYLQKKYKENEGIFTVYNSVVSWSMPFSLIILIVLSLFINIKFLFLIFSLLSLFFSISLHIILKSIEYKK